jgi:large subunit ribosomal protein L3
MQVAGKRTHPKSKKRVPPWHYRVRRSKTLDFLTNENQKFISERVAAEFGPKIMYKGTETYESQSLLKVKSIEPQQWKKGMHRVGTIAKKLGHYPLWLKDGKKINTTVLQIVDNHVVRYIPPGEFNPTKRKMKIDYSKWSCVMVGSGAANPTTVTANYAGLFKGTGVMPTKLLFRFIINPKAALPSGTPLNVSHYRVGDYVDVRAKT